MKVETVKAETRPDVVIRLSPTEADRLVQSLYDSAKWQIDHGYEGEGLGDNQERLGWLLEDLGYQAVRF